MEACGKPRLKSRTTANKLKKDSRTILDWWCCLLFELYTKHLFHFLCALTIEDTPNCISLISKQPLKLWLLQQHLKDVSIFSILNNAKKGEILINIVAKEAVFPGLSIIFGYCLVG